jgi:hypothetical protein
MLHTEQSTHAMVAAALCGEDFASLDVLDAQARIAEFGGDVEGYDEVAEMVLLEGDAMLRSLREAPRAGRAALAAVLHEVANNCAMVGADRCARLTRAVEVKLVKQLPLDMVPAMRAIDTELKQMLSQLARRMAS